MNKRTRLYLMIQYALGRAAVFLVAPLTFLILKLAGYQIEDLRQVRKTVAESLEGRPGGWIICANHLTMIDSVFVAWAFMSLPRYVQDFRYMPWNLPERRNFQKNPFVAALCYLAKCIPLQRGGDRDEMKRTMDVCAHLLENGSNLLIFPEGGRSRTGAIDQNNFSYGVGRLVQRCPSARVLCIYLRGLGQKRYSNFPRFREHFVVEVSPFTPSVTGGGLRGQRETARRIIEHLAGMERKWFARVSALDHRGSASWIRSAGSRHVPPEGRKTAEAS